MTTILIDNIVNEKLGLKTVLERKGLTVFTTSDDPFMLLSKYSACCPDILLIEQGVKERRSLLKHINSNYDHAYTLMYSAEDKISDIDLPAEHIDRIISHSSSAEDICKLILQDIATGKTKKRNTVSENAGIRTVLKELCVAPNYIGYKYLIDAVELIISNQNENLCLTKSIYPLIAKKYNVSIGSVERSIRTVVNNSWGKIPEAELIKYFGLYALTSSFKPSNSRFIYAVAEAFMSE